MPTKIFVGNLNEKSASEDLRVLFEKYGEVSECDIIKNFGFVVSHTKYYRRILSVADVQNFKVQLVTNLL